ncbi:MAG: PfkB family carbohydrate kinase, partial [Ornithinimicrobium sp.]
VNAHEAYEATGIEEPAAAGRRLCSLGATAALVSDGPRGVVVAVDEHGPVLTARLSTVLTGNPTGAGDAMTAALCATLHGHSLPPSLAGWTSATRTAVAWAGAAVLAPLAGTVDPRDVNALLPTVKIEENA